MYGRFFGSDTRPDVNHLENFERLVDLYAKDFENSLDTS